MTARCTVCGREWIIAAEQDKPGYICPSCETRFQLIKKGILKGENEKHG
ncbi:MAG: hypothetical protein ACFWTN_07500 [Clostridium sp.]|jgi:DNA-directed RNA polymerase subunit RPC12/RpoP